MVNTKELEGLIKEYTAMGFDPQEIVMAWLNSNQRKALVLDHLLAIAYYSLILKVSLNFSKEKGKTSNLNIPSKSDQVYLSHLYKQDSLLYMHYHPS